jgi:SAM-dependent methyltransferase
MAVASSLHISGGDLGLGNRKVFQRRAVLRQYGSASGWLEPGEQAALLCVAEEARGAPILDLGIGGGRTAPLLNRISADYHGIDFAPAMVSLAQTRFPTFDFREMDARCMDFHNGTFALALFSYNGIDSVDLEGRRAIMREVHRVLRPGGCFVFSALNRHGPEFLPHWPNWSVFRGVGLWPLRLLRATAKLLVGGVNRLWGAHRSRDYGEAAIGSLDAHNFALVTVFTSALETSRQLEEAGFSVEAMFDPQGLVLLGDDKRDTTAPWYYVVARKRAASGQDAVRPVA